MARLPDVSSLGGRPVPQPSGGVAQYSADSGLLNVPAQMASQVASDTRRQGQQLFSSGEELRVMYEREQERINAARTEDSTNQLREAQVGLTIGDDGFKRVLGGDVVKQPFAKNWLQKFDDSYNSISEKLDNQSQKDQFRQRYAVLRNQYNSDLQSHALSQSHAYQNETDKTSILTERKVIESNPKNDDVFDASLVRIGATVDASAARQGVPEAAEILKAKEIDSAIKSRLNALRVSDPMSAMQVYLKYENQLDASTRAQVQAQLFQDIKPVLASELLSGELKTSANTEAEAMAIMRAAEDMKLPTTVQVGKTKDVSNVMFESLPIDQKLQVMKAANTLKNQNNSLAQQMMSDRLKDASASYIATGSFPNPPSHDELVAVFGDYQGNKLYSELANTRDIGAAIQEIAPLPVSERAQLLESAKPTPGTGFASAQQRYEILAKAIDQSNQELARDPSGYVINHSGLVRTAYDKLAQATASQDPQQIQRAAQEYAITSTAEQTRLGIFTPKVLPKGMAEQEVAIFNKEITNGDNMATRIDAAAYKWGKYWPDVYRQLATEFKGNLPDSFLVIPGLSSQAAKEEVARLDHIKLEDMKKQFESSDVSDMQKSIQSELAPWAESMLSNQTNSNLYNAVSSSVLKMAMSRVQHGQRIKDAVNSSIETFIGQYEFSDNSSVRLYAIPKTENVDKVTAGVSRIISSLPNINIAPPPYGDLTGMRKKEEVDAEWKQIIMNNPLWVTNSDESGLKLYAIGQDGRQYPVNTPSGKQIEYTWEDFRSMVPEQFRTTDMRIIEREKAEQRAAELRQEWRRR